MICISNKIWFRRTATRITLLVGCIALGFFLATERLVAWKATLNPASLPQSRMREARWAERHREALKNAKEHSSAPLLLIGDSTLSDYDSDRQSSSNSLSQQTWIQFYASRNALNLCFEGDTTSNLLWRLRHGEVDGVNPKVTVLLIGTHNSVKEDQTSAQIQDGIDAVVWEIAKSLPKTHIVLLGILPSGVSGSKLERDQAINRHLASRYGEDSRVTYLDISSLFYRNGLLREELFSRGNASSPLFPTPEAHRFMAEAMEPTLSKAMGEEPKLPYQAMTDVNTALIPVDRIELDSYDWYERHHAVLAAQKKMHPRIVLVGDSITHFWGGEPKGAFSNGPSAWQKIFGKAAVLNLGFGWDRTQNVLWRLRQGEFEGLDPDWIVLEIGTNNLTSTIMARANTPEETLQGIEAVYRELKSRAPRSHIILMAIFPRGEKANDPLRFPIQETNRLLAQRFGRDSAVTYLDIGERFLSADGRLPVARMPDGTHPSDAGYQIWADALIKAGIHP